jgi:hypothetical protein
MPSDAKFMSVPTTLARLLNRVCGLPEGVHIVVLVKSASGARGIASWGVTAMKLELPDGIAKLGDNGDKQAEAG